ncbi:uncharacterized protein LOC124169327 [Ischnura elegans]|uniref:uncharacterized protein LOC124169327 n=1 Tax=Ischnura elegans TaxID=197161 RepID=UPI001ED8B9D9|nr:uncharacterized protein LOC124169327 [Ischnura elegans]
MTRSGRPEGSWIPRPAFLLVFLLVQQAALFASADDFFLKAAKSVPRIGRRAFGGGRGGGVRTITADVDHGFFMKAAKSVPRIGRRRATSLSGVAEGREWGMVWPWYRTPDSVPGPSLADSEPGWMSRRSGEEGWDAEGIPDWINPRLYVREEGGSIVEEGEPEKMEEERVDEGSSGRVVKRVLAPPAIRR